MWSPHRGATNDLALECLTEDKLALRVRAHSPAGVGPDCAARLIANGGRSAWPTKGRRIAPRPRRISSLDGDASSRHGTGRPETCSAPKDAHAPAAAHRRRSRAAVVTPSSRAPNSDRLGDGTRSDWYAVQCVRHAWVASAARRLGQGQRDDVVSRRWVPGAMRRAAQRPRGRPASRCRGCRPGERAQHRRGG